MAKKTENRGYNVPEEGEEDWHVPVNENWESIDADINDLYMQVGSDGHPDVIYADSADEIQPAIDELAGGRGGVVRLGAKTYYPTTTIWLKKGVTLAGVSRSRYTEKLSRTALDVSPASQVTVLSTRDMDRGSDVYTFEHDVDDPHPHFPVIAAYVSQPVQDGQDDTGNVTSEEQEYWGVDIGIKNLIIDASENQRWWDYSEHGSSQVYNGDNGDLSGDTLGLADSDYATYFGVYDAFIIERSENVLTENIETRNFLGYGGFWKDTRQAIDRGGSYEGGATDYHGSAYELATDHARDENRYVDGMWDFEAKGPLPTVTFGGHIDNLFVSGGWSVLNRITGEPMQFLGDEQRFWDGDAPVVDNTAASSIVRDLDQRTQRFDGYSLETSGGVTPEYGYYADHPHVSISNSRIGGDADIGVYTQNGIKIQDTTISANGTCIRSGAGQPKIQDVELKGEYGLSFSGRANKSGPWNGVRFEDINECFKQSNNKPVVLNHPSFHGAGSFGENFDELVINQPCLYGHLDDFPDEYMS
jgi:hypothetical protein